MGCGLAGGWYGVINPTATNRLNALEYYPLFHILEFRIKNGFS